MLDDLKSSCPPALKWRTSGSANIKHERTSSAHADRVSFPPCRRETRVEVGRTGRTGGSDAGRVARTNAIDETKGKADMCDRHSCNGHRPDRRRVLMGAAALGLAGAVGLRLSPAEAKAAKLDLPKPGPSDACPVCGMFPAKYPEWIATVAYKDGHADHFDGAKDLFKYLLDMPKFAGGRKREDIRAIGVTGYYSGELIDAEAAVYVAGSDVYGPMGHEPVPHADADEADGFAKDHKGRRTLAFAEVTQGFLFGLDEGRFDGK